MHHEPFYRTGVYSSDCGRLGIGWVSLTGAYADCLPIWSQSRSVCLFFSGEHYADAPSVDLRSAWSEGFIDDGATEILRLYERHGAQFVNHINGVFSGVLFDTRNGHIRLFNDRYGLGRLYCHQNSEGTYFASEAKSLLRIFPNLREFDHRSLAEWLVCGCPLQNRSLFRDISLMPPGSLWTFRPFKPPQKETYFSFAEWERADPLSGASYYRELKETFTRILPRYFRGSQRIGMSLTGGLDSRMIIAGRRAGPGELPCYTFSGTFRECADVRLARQIAGRCRQPYHTIPISGGFFPQFLDLAKKCVYVTDGAMDVSASTDVYANRLARAIAPVRMTGNYGSEVLRGHVAFKPATIPETAFSSDLRQYLREAADTYRSERQAVSPLSFILTKQMPWHHFARFSEEQSQLTVRAPYLDNDLVPLAFRAPRDSLLNKQFALRYSAEMDPRLADIPTDRGFLNLPSLVPRKLFRIYQELMPHVEYLFDYGMPDWLARTERCFALLHPERMFLGRQKYYHFRYWYRHNLAPQISAVLLDPSTLSRQCFNHREVERLVVQHTSGAGNSTLLIHKLLTVEFVYRHLLSQPDKTHF